MAASGNGAGQPAKHLERDLSLFTLLYLDFLLSECIFLLRNIIKNKQANKHFSK